MRSGFSNHPGHHPARIQTWLAPLVGGAVLAAAIALPGCSRGGEAEAQGGSGGAAGPAEVARNVRVVTLEPTTLEEYSIISGLAAPLRGTELSAEESGHVAAIPHDKGARVREGDVLILLDRRLLEAEMRAAKANEELATYNADRTRQLFEANSVSRIEMLDAGTRGRQAKAASDAAEIRYDRAAIKAPFDGIVVDRYVELGQLVAPGMPVGRVVDPYVLNLEGSVTEQEVRRVHEGEDALVTFEGLPEAVRGRVHWVGFEAGPLTGKFKVEIRVDNQDLAVRPGVIGRARVLQTEHREVLAIPRDALMLVSGQPMVYTIKDGRAERRDVVLGSSQGLMVIVEQGLAAGDQVVVRGHRDLRDGAPVLVQEVAVSSDGTLPEDPDVVTQARAISTGNVDQTER